eukprot:Skav212568  [mRNA]  locus=scaffold125:57033:57350:- [translate_table: standard]
MLDQSLSPPRYTSPLFHAHVAIGAAQRCWQVKGQVGWLSAQDPPASFADHSARDPDVLPRRQEWMSPVDHSRKATGSMGGQRHGCEQFDLQSVSTFATLLALLHS